MKKYIAMLLSCILIMSQGTIIFAGEMMTQKCNMNGRN